MTTMTSVDSWKGVKSVDRLKGFNCLFKVVHDVNICIEIESAFHSIAISKEMYIDKLLQLLHNLRQNANLANRGKNIIQLSDAEMAQGTILEFLQNEAIMRVKRFDQMLQDKYDSMNDKTYASSLKCNKCGSSDVTWEQKQTRSADEAMTVFCTCSKCKLRWKMC